MTDSVDLTTYGSPNDLAEDEPAPREPRGDPDVTTDAFDVWCFDANGEVPDVYVVARQPDPLDFRMWVFVGEGDRARFTLRASHRYGPDEVVPGVEDCCEVLFDGQSLRKSHCPVSVRDTVRELTNAAIDWPERPGGQDGPITY